MATKKKTISKKRSWLAWFILWDDGELGCFRFDTRKEAKGFCGGPGNKGRVVRARVTEV